MEVQKTTNVGTFKCYDNALIEVTVLGGNGRPMNLSAVSEVRFYALTSEGVASYTRIPAIDVVSDMGIIQLKVPDILLTKKWGVRGEIELIYSNGDINTTGNISFAVVDKLNEITETPPETAEEIQFLADIAKFYAEIRPTVTMFMELLEELAPGTPNDVLAQLLETQRQITIELPKINSDFNKANADLAKLLRDTEAAIARGEELDLSFANTEASRVSAEQARVISETNRSNNENTRNTKETQRQTGETSRVSSENLRRESEAIRQSNEQSRIETEQRMIILEDAINEKSKITNEFIDNLFI